LTPTAGLPSFPTRRSSDLAAARRADGEGPGVPGATTGFDEAHPEYMNAANTHPLALRHNRQRRRRPRRADDGGAVGCGAAQAGADRKSTRLNSSHVEISYA